MKDISSTKLNIRGCFPEKTKLNLLLLNNLNQQNEGISQLLTVNIFQPPTKPDHRTAGDRWWQSLLVAIFCFVCLDWGTYKSVRWGNDDGDLNNQRFICLVVLCPDEEESGVVSIPDNKYTNRSNLGCKEVSFIQSWHYKTLICIFIGSTLL